MSAESNAVLSSGEREKTAQLIVRSLKRYPNPVPVQIPQEDTEDGASCLPSFKYVPVIPFAVNLYAAQFQKSEEEAIIIAGMVKVVPAVMARVQDFASHALESEEKSRETAQLLNDLTGLAAIFSGPISEVSYDDAYKQICRGIQVMLGVYAM